MKKEEAEKTILLGRTIALDVAILFLGFSIIKQLLDGGIIIDIVIWIGLVIIVWLDYKDFFKRYVKYN